MNETSSGHYPPLTIRNPLFTQLDAWKKKGWHVELREANGNGWVCIVDNVGFMGDPNDHGGEMIRLKVVSSIQPTPEAAITDLLTAVRP